MWLRAGAGSGALPTAGISSAMAAPEDGSGRSWTEPVAARLMTSRAISVSTAGSCCGTRSSLSTGDTGKDRNSTATIADATGPERRQNPIRRRNRRACVNGCFGAVVLLLVLMRASLVRAHTAMDPARSIVVAVSCATRGRPGRVVLTRPSASQAGDQASSAGSTGVYGLAGCSESGFDSAVDSVELAVTWTRSPWARAYDDASHGHRVRRRDPASAIRTGW